MNRSLTRRGVVGALAGLTLVATSTASAHGAARDYHDDPASATTEPAEGDAAAVTDAEDAAEDTEMAEDTAPVSTIDPADLEGAVVAIAESEEFGLHLVDGDGMSLYGFTNDTDGESSCTGECLANWPILGFDGDEFAEGDLAPILNPERFSTVENPEAGPMVRVGDWPLYRFAGDAEPGDTNGQGVLDVWYLVRPDGSLIDGSLVRFVASEEFGEHLVDADGMSLYAFLNDTDGESTCVEDCALNWPPLLVEDEVDVGMLDPEMFGVVEHPEGGEMLTFSGWPLYYFAADEEPGDTNGQGVNDIWYLLDPDGNTIEE